MCQPSLTEGRGWPWARNLARQVSLSPVLTRATRPYEGRADAGPKGRFSLTRPG
jgi:hypothetical protein